MKFNINDTVLVKITDRGMEILRNNHDYALGHLSEKFPFEEPAKDENGYSSMQLYQLARHFGTYFALGEVELPIGTEIIIPDPSEDKPHI